MIFHFEHGTPPGSLELAYLGDALYDLYVREHLIARGGKVRAMHREAISLVCAHAQSEALDRIEDRLMITDNDTTTTEILMMFITDEMTDAPDMVDVCTH